MALPLSYRCHACGVGMFLMSNFPNGWFKLLKVRKHSTALSEKMLITLTVMLDKLNDAKSLRIIPPAPACSHAQIAR